MSEHKLRDAFDHMGPDEAARERMLQNILQAHEAGVGAETQPDELPQKQLRRRIAREFSLLRYALPIAACLLFAALIPPALPELVTAFEESISTPSFSESSGGPSSEVSSEDSPLLQEPEDQQTGAQQPVDQQPVVQEPDTQEPGDNAPGEIADEVTPHEPIDDPLVLTPEATPTPTPSVVVEVEVPMEVTEAPSYAPVYEVEVATPLMAIPDPWPSPVDSVALTLSALALLAAIFITIRGILSWRRTRQK